MIGLERQCLAVEGRGLGHIAHKGQVRDVPGGGGRLSTCLLYGARLRFEVTLERLFCRQRVPSRQRGKCLGQLRTFFPRRLRQLALQFTDGSPQPIELIDLQPTCLFESRNPLPRRRNITQQFVEIRFGDERRSRRDFPDQSTRVVLPSIFCNLPDVPERS